MVSIKQFFSEHAMLYNAKVEAKPESKERYHVDVAVPEHLEDPVLKPEKAESKKHYHVDVEVAGTIEEPVIAPEKVSVFKSYFAGHKAIWAAKTKAAVQPAPPADETKYTLDHEMDALNLWSPWAAKTKAAKAPAPPAGETKYTLDHEMDAFNLWSPWAAKTKAAKGMAPLTERERENIKNKSWTV
ncbi:hypothetical protein PBCVAP110A_003L [Paramecium bursaria Chlorella virus AP110A]|nr:hypothetical protein PBCVAP110A_003L [Paramecium bursaria Chlorella virus AP110A]